MQETSKSKSVRKNNFLEKYLNGSILDIGAGNDPISMSADAFDLEQGDANHIKDYIPKNKKYDTVYSSHTLEHLDDPKKVIFDWFSLINPGGHLIIIVPDEDLYEQNIWPSYFSDEHKWSFRMNDKKGQNLKNSLNLNTIIPNVLKENFKICEAKIEDINYNYDLKFRGKRILNKNKVIELAIRLIRKIKSNKIKDFFYLQLVKLGYPIDQTYNYNERLAQQVFVIKKIN